ncbi:MAG TPA: hypothetical protein VLW53_06080, partial [Candidatus Eisenbacteria bacterium]|nr:hypothetical protein [Candidatus Eisenbacteria bacterium]
HPLRPLTRRSRDERRKENEREGDGHSHITRTIRGERGFEANLAMGPARAEAERPCPAATGREMLVE